MPHFVGNIGENCWQYRKNIKKEPLLATPFFLLPWQELFSHRLTKVLNIDSTFHLDATNL